MDDPMLFAQVIKRPRRAPRVNLPSPVPASVGDIQVILHDISAIGAGIAHQQRLPRDFSGSFSFWWEGIRIEMQCSVVRTSLEKQQHGGVALTVYHSGLVFESADEATRRALEKKVAESLAQQNGETPLAATVAATDFQPDDSNRGALLNLNDFFPATRPSAPMFLRCSFESGRWIRKVTPEPSQPDEGFTLLALEGESEIDTLCWTYQETDQAGRNLIRTFAHLTVSGG